MNLYVKVNFFFFFICVLFMNCLVDQKKWWFVKLFNVYFFLLSLDSTGVLFLLWVGYKVYLEY